MAGRVESSETKQPEKRTDGDETCGDDGDARFDERPDHGVGSGDWWGSGIWVSTRNTRAGELRERQTENIIQVGQVGEEFEPDQSRDTGTAKATLRSVIGWLQRTKEVQGKRGTHKMPKPKSITTEILASVVILTLQIMGMGSRALHFKVRGPFLRFDRPRGPRTTRRGRVQRSAYYSQSLRMVMTERE